MDLAQSVILAGVGGVVGLLSARFGAHWNHRAALELERLKWTNSNRGLLHEDRVSAYSEFFNKMSLTRPILRHLDDTGSRRSDKRDAWNARNEMWYVYTRVALIGQGLVQEQAYQTLNVVDEVLHGVRPYREEDFSELVRKWIDVCRSGLIPPEADELTFVSRT